VIAIKAKRSWTTWQIQRKSRFPLVLFSQELLGAAGCRPGLVESLETLLEKELQPDVKKTLTQIVVCLYEGHPLSYALQQSALIFRRFMWRLCAPVKRPAHCLKRWSRYIAYQSQMDVVKRQVISASIYPALLACVGGLVMLFLMVYVVPRFSHIYA